VTYCDTCGTQIDPSEAYEIFSQDGRPLKVCKDCKKMSEWMGKPILNFSEDKLSDKSLDELMHQRPLGVTILAALQIIGAVISFILIFLLPSLFEQYRVNELFGMPLLELVMTIAIISIPISILLGIGLLRGEKWTKTTTIFLQFSNVITSLINFNFLGIFIPIIIIYYLKTPDVDKFFNKEPRFNTTIKNIIIIGVIFEIIINILLSLLILSLKFKLLSNF